MIEEKENIREVVIKIMIDLEGMSYKQAKVTYQQNINYYKTKYKIQIEENLVVEDKEFDNIDMESLKKQLQLNCFIKIQELN
jgi:hypothetical protein